MESEPMETESEVRKEEPSAEVRAVEETNEDDKSARDQEADAEQAMTTEVEMKPDEDHGANGAEVAEKATEETTSGDSVAVDTAEAEQTQES